MINKIKNNLVDFYKSTFNIKNGISLLLIVALAYIFTNSIIMCVIVTIVNIVAVYVIYQILKNFYKNGKC